MRAVVDTNILISGLLSGTGAPRTVVDAIIDGRITPVFSTETFDELGEVLKRPKLKRYLHRSDINAEKFLALLEKIADLVEPVDCPFTIRDPKDRPFLALVATPPQPDMLVTGDKDFTAKRYGGVPVVKAADLARELE